MKRLVPIFLLVMLFSCEKDPQERLIGVWSDNNPAFKEGESMSFSEDGACAWGTPCAYVDPNCWSGIYSFKSDTLMIIIHSWITDTVHFFYEVDRNELWLYCIEDQTESTYTRKRKL